MPSDYLVVENGRSYFAEVKSTQNNTSFPFSLLKETQKACAKMILAAGGSYFVFVHQIKTGIWYMIPYQKILETEPHSSSIKWDDLKEYIRW